MIPKLYDSKLAKLHFQAVRDSIELRIIEDAIIKTSKLKLDPVIFKAKFTSISKSIFTAFQNGGRQMCIKFIDKLQALSEGNTTFVISYEGNGLQYIPSLLVSLAISPPCVDALVSVLRCLSTLTNFSYSRRFGTQEFLAFLCQKMRSPQARGLQHFNISMYSAQDDPMIDARTPEEIQRLCLRIIRNLLKKISINFEEAASVGLFDAIFSISDGPNCAEVMKVLKTSLETCFKEEEINEEIFSASFQLFTSKSLSTDIDEQSAAFSGLADLIRINPEASLELVGTDILVAVYEQMHNTDDNIFISAISLITAILETGLEVAIKAITNMFNWGIFPELWESCSKEHKQVLCEFVNTTFSYDPIQVTLAYNNSVFDILISCFDNENYSLRVEAIILITTATSINSQLLIPLIIDKGIINIMSEILTTSDNRAVMHALKLIDLLVSIETDSTTKENIKLQLEESGTLPNVEYVTDAEEVSEAANEIFTELQTFLDC